MSSINPKESKRMLETFVSLEDEIAPPLISKKQQVISSDKGDPNLKIETDYVHAIGAEMKERGFPMKYSVEGKFVIDDYGESGCNIAHIDPDESSANLLGGWLPHGLCLLVTPSGDDVQFDDWIISLLGDRQNNRKYATFRGENGPEPRLITGLGENAEWGEPNLEQISPLIEIPTGYIPIDDIGTKLKLTAYTMRITEALGNTQTRSVDCTGPNSARVGNRESIAYVEARSLRKLGNPSDFGPSVAFVEASGGKATYLDGSPIRGTVWSDGPNGYNSDFCRNAILAYDAGVHEKIVNAIGQIRGREEEYLKLRGQNFNLSDENAIEVLRNVEDCSDRDLAGHFASMAYGGK